MSEATRRLEQLEHDVELAYKGRHASASAHEARRFAKRVKRIVIEHPRWGDLGEALWVEAVERVSIGRLARYLDHEKLRIRVRAHASLELYLHLASVPLDTRPSASSQADRARAYLDRADALRPQGHRFADLALHLLAGVEARRNPGRPDTYDTTLAHLRETRSAWICFSSPGRTRVHGEDLLLEDLEAPLVELARRVTQRYADPAWDRVFARFREIGALSLAARRLPKRRPKSQPPFSEHHVATISNTIKVGLGPTFAMDLSLELSAVLGGGRGVAAALAEACGAYDRTLAAEAEARRQRRELFVKLLGAALTPVLGPLASVVTEGMSTLVELGVKALEEGGAVVGEALAPAARSFGAAAARSFSEIQRSTDARLEAGAEAARERVSDELKPEAIATRIGDRVFADTEPTSFERQLGDALDQELERFLRAIASALEATRSDLLDALGASGGGLDAAAVARTALWHMHATYAGDEGYHLVDDALLGVTNRFLDDYFASAAAQLRARFSLGRLEVRRPPGLERLVEWKLWGLHLDAVWGAPQRPLESIELLSSSELAERLEAIGFMIQTSEDKRSEGIVRFGKHRLGDGAKALGGAFVRYVVDAFDPFTVLTGARTVQEMEDEKEAVVRALYDSLSHRRSRGETPSWSDLWSDARRVLPPANMAQPRSVARPSPSAAATSASP